MECSWVCLTELCVCLDLVNLQRVAVRLALTKSIDENNKKLEGAVVVIDATTLTVGIRTELLVSLNDTKVVEAVFLSRVRLLQQQELPQVDLTVNFVVEASKVLLKN